MIIRLEKLKLLLLILLLNLLSACVTEDLEGNSKKHIDKDEAYKVHIQLIQNYVAKKNRESARHHLRKALELKKNTAEVLNAQAMVFQLEGETALAEDSYRKAIKKDKKFSAAFNNYGVFLFGLKRYEDALVQFEAAAANIDFDGRSEAMVNLGRCALFLGDTVKARAAFEHSAILNRGLPDPLIELADIYFIDQDYSKAKEYLDRYMSLGVLSPRALLLAIRLEKMFGNKDKEASYLLLLKNRYPYSKEYLEYRRTYSR